MDYLVRSTENYFTMTLYKCLVKIPPVSSEEIEEEEEEEESSQNLEEVKVPGSLADNVAGVIKEAENEELEESIMMS